MAQTLAELLVKIKTEGADQVKRELRDIEEALRKANAASERNIKSFERSQNRIIAGQKRMMTSGGAGGSSIGIDPKALDEVTRALKDMAGPLNAVIDGFTQFAQIFTVGNVRRQMALKDLQDSIKASGKMVKRSAKAVGSDEYADIRAMPYAVGGTPFFRKDEYGRVVFRGGEEGRSAFSATMMAGGADARSISSIYSKMDKYNNLIDQLNGNSAELDKLLTEQNKLREQSIPIWERLNTQTKIGIALALANIAVYGSATKALYDFAKGASQAGIEYESMRARITGMDKKGSSTDQIFALARSVAGPTKFTTKQMEEASVSLLSYGVNVERTLPLIGKLGQAFGADQEKLNQYTRAFGMLVAGQMPDNEVLGAMGITKKQLSAEGVKFDKSGGLISSTEKVMLAMEKIINTKYAKVIRETANTTESLRASIQDSFEGIQRSFGIMMNKGLGPFTAEFGKTLAMIEDSKFAETVATDFIAPITVLTGQVGTLTDAFKQLIAYSAAFATAIPRQLGKAVDEWNHVSTQQNFLGDMQRVGSRSMTIFRFLGGLFDPTGSGLGATENVIDTANKYLADMNKKGPKVPLNTKRMTDPFGGILPFGGDDNDKGGKKTKRTLEKIENNTRKSAELLDLRRQTIGGGEIASLGITGAEIAGMGLKNRSEISLRSPIRPDTQVIRGIKDLVYGNMNFALQGSPINRVRF